MQLKKKRQLAARQRVNSAVGFLIALSRKVKMGLFDIKKYSSIPLSPTPRKAEPEAKIK